MAGIHCKRCGSLAFVRNGIVRGHQRYRCSDCGYNFTDTPPRGKPPAMKALAILLYAMGNASLGMIARLLGVSNVAVLKWVRQEAMTLPEPTTPAEVEIVQIDEMGHFVNGKKTNAGSGGPSIRSRGEPWPGSWVTVTIGPVSDSWPRSASPGASS